MIDCWSLQKLMLKQRRWNKKMIACSEHDWSLTTSFEHDWISAELLIQRLQRGVKNDTRVQGHEQAHAESCNLCWETSSQKLHDIRPSRPSGPWPRSFIIPSVPANWHAMHRAYLLLKNLDYRTAWTVGKQSPSISQLHSACPASAADLSSFV